MMAHWEVLLLGFTVGILVIYSVAYLALVWVGAPRTSKPIYGPADPYRRDGQPRPNVRVGS